MLVFGDVTQLRTPLKKPSSFHQETVRDREIFAGVGWISVQSSVDSWWLFVWIFCVSFWGAETTEDQKKRELGGGMKVFWCGDPI